MFSFFRKKEVFKVKDIVWMSEQIKFEALDDEADKHSETIVVAWFDETYDKLERFFSFTTSHPTILLARQLNFHHIENKNVIFAEHYPLAKKEIELFENLKLKEAIVHSSLDEPLIIRFAGDKLQELMRRMGMKEDEPIQHTMITTSIKNLQKKIGKQVTLEQSARSQGDWLTRNML